MNIGTLISLRQLELLEDRLSWMRSVDMDHCQLLSWLPEQWTPENAEMIKGLLEKYSITVTAFWCGWSGPVIWNFYEGPLTLGLVPAEYRQTRIRDLCNGADFAKSLGITDVVTHMGYIPENPHDPNFIPFCIAVRTVAQHLKKNGQYLLFETGQETPVTLLRCFEEVNMDNLGINLDTANLIMYGKANPVDALDVFGKYVRNLHAKDGKYPTSGKELGIETKLGEGKVDFPALFRKLKELGYDSHVTIEREIDGEQQRQDIVNARNYLQQLISQIYGG